MSERRASEIVRELRQELSLARALAWAEYRRMWEYAWFPGGLGSRSGAAGLVRRPADRSSRQLRRLTPDVTAVRVLHDHVVEVTFSDGLVGEYDFAGKLTGPAFEPVRTDYTTFCSIQLSSGGGTVAWPLGADPDRWPDWSPEELYQHILLRRKL